MNCMNISVIFQLRKVSQKSHQTGLYGCHSRRKPPLKMVHKKVCKQFTEDKHVLWSERRLTYLVQMVPRLCPDGEFKDQCVLPPVKHGGGSVTV